MRRKDKMKTDQDFLDNVLNSADEMYFSFNTDGAPYIVPLNFTYFNGKIYVHCAHEGRKIDCIKNDARIGFCAATDVCILAKEASTKFRSVIGTGNASIVQEVEEKRAALNAIAKRYQAGCEIPATDSMVARTCVICVEITEICGKQSPSDERWDGLDL